MLFSFRSPRCIRFAGAAVASAVLATVGPLGAFTPASAASPKISLSQEISVRSPGEEHTVTARATGADGQPVPDGTALTFTVSGPTGAIRFGEPAVGVALAAGGTGGWVARADGGVSPFGTAPAIEPPAPVGSPAIELAGSPSGAGYWVTTSAGHVLRAGDASYFGDLGNVRLNGPIQAMAPTPTGRGYWLVGNDGGIFAFGDAGFYGSTGAMKLPKPISGIMATPSGRGYWLYASDGAVYQFGDAQDFGDTGAIRLNHPIVDAVPTASGRGYWLVASDGGVFSFGDARFFGSAGNVRLSSPIVRIASSPTGRGYVMVNGDGQVLPFGDGPSSSGYSYTARTVGGRATLTFRSFATGESVVGASFGAPTIVKASPMTVRWHAGPWATVGARVIPGGRIAPTLNAAVIATVKDDRGNPVDDGVPVTFTVHGTGAESPASATVPTTRGEARFEFTSAEEGYSEVSISVGGSFTTAAVEWDATPPTGGGSGGSGS
ncbi:MAG TPA: hypothetical protein VEG38_19715, partial [Acidimicrobiia bacterium]|nr:hypothetical protein [Acidimicrobiia bacterium]